MASRKHPDPKPPRPKLRRKTDPKPPPVNRRHTDAEVMVALKKNANVISRAADALGITRSALWQRIDGNKELQDFRASLDATVNDAAKSIVLQEIIKKKSVKVAQWWLERRDPDFKTRAAVDARLPEDQLLQLIRGLSGVGGLAALKKVREAMATP